LAATPVTRPSEITIDRRIHDAPEPNVDMTTSVASGA
jgi:hypothetical protein